MATTRLSRDVTRVVTDNRGRQIKVTLGSHGLTLSLLGKRTRYTLPYETAFLKAADLFAAAEKREREERRRALHPHLYTERGSRKRSARRR
jgi:hypothetical protein